MSKAFTRESDDAPEAPPSRRGVPVPTGVPNYLTAAGARSLRAELDTLIKRARDPDTDARIVELTEHLRTAEIVEPTLDPDRVTFGSTVTVEGDEGEHTYKIVGAIEASPRDHAINWQSPLARALLGAKRGDTVTLPRGDAEVLSIS